MAEAPRRAARRRRWPYVLLALSVLVVAAGIALYRWTRPQALADLLASQVRARFGLELTFDPASEIGLAPDPRARLRNLVVRDGGATILRAESFEASMPWATLWRDRIEIERIGIVRPVIDVAALRDWLASRPASDADAPDVRATLHVQDARVIDGERTLADGIDIDLANRGDLAAWLQRLAHDSALPLPPAIGRIEADRVEYGETRVEGLRIELGDGPQ